MLRLISKKSCARGTNISQGLANLLNKNRKGDVKSPKPWPFSKGKGNDRQRKLLCLTRVTREKLQISRLHDLQRKAHITLGIGMTHEKTSKEIAPKRSTKPASHIRTKHSTRVSEIDFHMQGPSKIRTPFMRLI